MSSILFVAGEGLPYVKSGGLADVIGALPKVLVQRGHDVSVVLPLYRSIATKYRPEFERLKTFEVHCGNIHTIATIFSQELDGVHYYFVEHAGYFERDGLYGHADDAERFSFFQKAVLEMIEQIDIPVDIIHAHDWHAGMISALCRFHYPGKERYQRIKHVFTIHNLAYQGNFPTSVLWDCLGLPMEHYYDGTMRFYDGISFMKSAVVFSDKISTVSNTYAQEITTPEFGENMDEVLKLRKHDLWGIVNGIDMDNWDPNQDPLLENHYSVKNYKGNKPVNKKKLQEEMGLPVSKDTLLIAMVTRLTWQKGVYLILEKLAEILALDVQFIILGSGETKAEDSLKDFAYRFNRKMTFYCGYNEALAHRIYAGADVLLMPSLFEPCGISQLIAMRYGTLPLVRETGGLKDTVIPFNQYTNEGTGFSFFPFNAHDLWSTIKLASDTYYGNKEGFNALIVNAMNKDVSFDRSCDLYEQLYRELV